MSATESTIKPEWTVIGPYLRKLVDTAADLGVDRSQLLADIGVDARELVDSEKRFPMTALIKAFSLAAARSGCEDIGLKFGYSLSIEDQGWLGYIACCTSNMTEALETFTPIRRIMMHSGTTECVKTTNFAIYTWTPLVPEFDKERYFAEAIFANWISSANERVGVTCIPAKVEFTSPAPADLTQLQAIFGDNLHFACGQNRITLHREDAERPFKPMDDQAVVSEYEQQQLIKLIETDLKHIPDSLLTTALVEKHIMRLLPTGECNLTLVAEQLHMTERTLQRRLKVDATRFNELLKNVRLRWGRNYLAETDMAITDIALLLGYQETSAFTHAFKNWTGMSPAEYRRDMLEQEKQLQ
ncbi:AraC family transcriptional regulator [Maricurvus nonylphenolicus]|uniref:AraC family transcriptional regulator n=1 Tax=Maricurvus nonylphenolicus TaxID=1008307 RepID=UPI0036F1D0F9